MCNKRKKKLPIERKIPAPKPESFFFRQIQQQMELDKTYWQNRYRAGDTPWDIGHASPPLMEFLDGISDLETRILIPGAGRAYEAIYLHRKGFRQVFVCDWAAEAFEVLRRQAPDFPVEHLLCQDFFELEGEFDLILEQTFFCAVEPSRRKDYVSKVEKLLRSKGILVGLLFAQPFGKPGPPFGGTENDYLKLFAPKFEITKMEVAKNSILPRSQNELFFQFIKK